MKPYQRFQWILWLTFLLLLALPLACTQAPAPGPTVSWLPLPTRALTPTPVPGEAYLPRVELALVAGEPEVARAAWEEAAARAPEAPEVLRAGARLALALGEPALAEERAEAALALDAEDAEGWSLLGLLRQRRGDAEGAAVAFETALTLDPQLAPALFPARWRLALERGESEALTRLAQEQLMRTPEDPLNLYFRAEALLAAEYTEQALELLLLHMGSNSPAVLWYTLGRVYLAQGAHSEGIIALEAAQRAYSRGDRTLLLATDDPTYALSAHLGRAYIDTLECERAEALLRLQATPYPDFIPLVEEARGCPTRTPTPTPWLPWDNP